VRLDELPDNSAFVPSPDTFNIIGFKCVPAKALAVLDGKTDEMQILMIEITAVRNHSHEPQTFTFSLQHEFAHDIVEHLIVTLTQQCALNVEADGEYANFTNILRRFLNDN
jgi:hypothetical protein